MELGHMLPLWSIIPFVGMLLSIAIFPLVKGEWWESHELHVGHALSFGNRSLSLTNNLLANGRGSDSFIAALKNAHIKFLFQFHQHGTQRRL